MKQNRLKISAFFILFSHLISAQVLHYDFESNLNDQSGNGFNGTSVNPSNYVSNEHGDGQARVFNGAVGDVVSFPNDPTLKPSNFPVTIAVTARITDLNGSPNHTLFSSDITQNTYYGTTVLISPAGAVSVSIGNGTTTNPYGRRSFNTATGIIQENVWYHIVAVIRGPNVGDIDVWVNCNKYTSTTDYACGTVISQSSPFYSGCATVSGFAYNSTGNGGLGIGDVTNSSPYIMIGEMDELRFYTNELTEAEILDLNGSGISASLSGGDVLASFADPSLQWLDCGNNYAPIANETAQLFSPTVTGNYAVTIDNDGCRDTSNCVFVDLAGVEELNKLASVQMFPNPSSGICTIDLGAIFESTLVKVCDMQGRVILEKKVVNQQVFELEINEASGTYLVHIFADERINGTLMLSKN